MHSVSLRASIPCDRCGGSIDADVWVVVDVAERADLLERIRAGRLHTFTCPACQNERRMSASLLVYNPEGAPPLIFSPIKAGTPDSQRKEANGLAAELRKRLGEAWRDEWLADGLVVATREQLATFLVPANLIALNNGGLAQQNLFKRTRDRAALAEAISAFEQSLEQVPETWLVRADILGNLGLALRDRFQELGDIADLQQAITYHGLVMAATTRTDPKRPSRLTYLGLALRDRYRQLGDADDLEAAIRNLREAADLVPAGAPDRAIHVNRVANVIGLRYDTIGDPKDLDQAVTLWREALQIAPAGSADRTSILQNLAGGLGQQYDVTGNRALLEEAITTWTDLLRDAPAASQQRRDLLTSLGGGLRSRYRRAGDPADLERAIDAGREAIDSVAADSPAYSGVANSLAGGLSDRYERSGTLGDLEEAIQLFRRAVEQTPISSPDRPRYLVNLGSALHTRFRLTSVRGDLDEAVPALDEAVQRTPSGLRSRASRLNKLAGALTARDRTDGGQTDLDRAIDLFRDGLLLAPQSSTDRLELLSNLGGALRQRGRRDGRQADLGEALDLWQQALASSDPGSPERSAYLANLATGLRDRFVATSAPADLERARTTFREACERGLTTNLEAALTAGQTWGAWALERRDWSEACEAYGYGLRAIDALLKSQMMRGSGEAWLRVAQRLNRDAAFALARNGDASSAVTVLEAGRARLLGDALERDRADLQNLPARGHAEAYERYVAAVDKIALFERVEASARVAVQFSEAAAAQGQLDHPRFSSTESLATERDAASAQLRDAIAAIQRIEGYEDFFAPPTIDSVLQAFADPDHRRVAAYLIVTSVGGVALVVHAGRVEPIWFDLTNERFRDVLMTRDGETVTGGYVLAQLDRALLSPLLEPLVRDLSTTIVSPLAAAVQTMVASESVAADMVELLLIPTGLLSLCPLHAARVQIGNEDRALADVFTVSYAPSARAFRHCRERLASVAAAPARLLGVGNPQPLPARIPPLLYARTEVEEIAPLFAGRAITLVDTDATRETVLDRLENTSYLHFACHGHFDPSAPLDSHLILGAGMPLRVSHLMSGLVIDSLRLVVLSACQTAITDAQTLPEEALGMPSAFLQAGAPGVIATLWSVIDVSTALLMVQFYRYHLVGDPEASRGPLPAPAALQRAQQWLRGLTNTTLAALLDQKIAAVPDAAGAAYRLAAEKLRPYVSQYPDARPFEAPIFWAAFVYYGI